ncbi:MAG: acetyl-CoA carboxylase carboxyltransferase subunit alpha [Verrucomicrobia bacterium]|nr:acetyl-CoA carboxylase carboxyltransferase subunit alpha [Verrucomicrobiota bacterium]MBS0646077.1 acetyl-CoA carboxylase carboxyltransferase subunit alpha [Verrucomicrobiota bacterium]
MELLPHEKQIAEYEKTIRQFKEQSQQNALFSVDELKKLERRLDQLKKKVYSNLSPWERVLICRHPNRPKSCDFIRNICDSFFELAGDRTFSDDHAVIGGLGKINGQKFMIIGQEKGSDTESRLYRNFGMVNPEGFRKALRLAQLAAKFQLPVIFFLDTPGAYPGLTAEERGQGWAIATNLRELFRLETPIFVVVIGEGCSGGALGMGIGDSISMLEHAYYSVISPEACASILWKNPEEKALAASTLKMHAEDLMQFEIIDTIIPEPLGGAHHNPEEVYQNVRKHLLEQREVFSKYPKHILLERRYQKFRKMGCYTSNETVNQSRDPES